jgi:hypothetical protein
MKTTWKRRIAWLLVLFLAVTFVPTMGMRVHAEAPPETLSVTLSVYGSKEIKTKEDLEDPDLISEWYNQTCEVAAQTDAEALTRQLLTEEAGHTLEFFGEFLATIGIKDKGINTGGVTNGSASYWSLLIKHAGDEDFQYSMTSAKGYTLQDGDIIKWQFVNDPTWPPNVIYEPPESPVALTPTPDWWVAFRGNLNNNLAVKKDMPVPDATPTLLWNSFIEEKSVSEWGTFPAAISDLLIINDKIFYAADHHLVRLNKTTGEREHVTELRNSIQYLSRLAYAYGMILVPFDGGGLQAIDPDTMETVWVAESIDVLQIYRPEGDEWIPHDYPIQSLGTTYVTDGVAYMPLTAMDGYTGTAGIFRAIDLKTGQTLWQYTDYNDGFYWSGGVRVGDRILIGNNGGIIYSFALDGSNAQKPDMIEVGAPIRSTLVSDGEYVYFSTATIPNLGEDETQPNEAGAFHALKADLSDHQFVNFAAYSTSTPVIHNGKAYVGGNDASFQGVLGVIDLKTMQAKTLPVGPGAIQSSPLLVVDTEGKTHLYFTANADPGKLYVYENEAIKEYYVPTEAAANYTLASPVVDRDANLYYTTDSGVIIALQLKSADVQPTEPTEPDTTEPSVTETEPEPTPTDPVAPPKTGESELYVLYALLLFAAAGAVTLGHRVVKQRQR